MLGLFGGIDSGPLNLAVYGAICLYVAYRTIIKEWPSKEANVFRNWVVGLLTVIAALSLLAAVFALAFPRTDDGPELQPIEDHGVDARPSGESRKTPEVDENRSKGEVEFTPIEPTRAG